MILFGLPFYIKFGDGVIDEQGLPALNSIFLRGIKLGKFIENLAWSSVMFFALEIISGIVGILAVLQKSTKLLFLYVFLCVVAILVYAVQIVFWSILQEGIDGGSINSSFNHFKNLYDNNGMTSDYTTMWKDFYLDFSCCGTSGENTCANVGTHPGCYDKFVDRMNPYIRFFLTGYCIMIILQIINIIATDYTMIKVQMKDEKRKISSENGFVLCLCHYGIIPTALGFLKIAWMRAPYCFMSTVFNISHQVVGIGLLITGICFLDSDLVNNNILNGGFREMMFYDYNFHDLMAGFVSGFIAIGCIHIGNGIIGLFGTKLKSTLLHTMSFFTSLFLLLMELIALIFFAVMFNKVTFSLRSVLNYIYDIQRWNSGYREFFNTLMQKFHCCEFSSTSAILKYFCYSNERYSMVTLTNDYINVDYSSTFHSCCQGEFLGYKNCSDAIEERLRVTAGLFFAFTAVGIICDIVGPFLTSKEFKEEQRGNLEINKIQDVEDMELPFWLLKNLKKDKPKNIYLLIYIICTVFMFMLELSFIVLTSIFAVSNHVDRDYIHDIGNFYNFLAISAIVLAVLCMATRITGLAGLYNVSKKTMYVSMVFMFGMNLLCLAYIIMASVLRYMEYPCKYTDNTSYVKDCSANLEATTGMAIGMFVKEAVMQMFLVFVHDKGYKYSISDGDSADRKGLTKTIYDFLIGEKQVFKTEPKFKIPFALYMILSAIVLLIEITFIFLTSFYGISYYIDRTWITSGLYNITVNNVNLGLLFDFIAIGSLVLIPILAVNRFAVIVIVLKSKLIFLYMNTTVLAVTSFLTIIFICLTSFLLGHLHECSITSSAGVQYSCPDRKYSIVGIALAMFMLELTIQIVSYIISDNGYKYIKQEPKSGKESADQTQNSSGMFTTMYKTFFRRRESYKNATKLEICIQAHVFAAVFMFTLEFCFIVLVSIYCISSMLDMTWILEGLDKITVSSLNLGKLFDCLSIGALVLIPFITVNRFVGIIAISTNSRYTLLVNSGLMSFTILINAIFLILASILLNLESECTYLEGSIVFTSCPKMKVIVGVGIAMFALELLMQMFTVFVNDRSYKYISSKVDSGSNSDGLFTTIVNKVIMERKLLAEHAQIKVPVLIVFSTTLGWLVVEIVFWVGIIIEMGSPRLINDNLMSILYTETKDDINLGYLADGLSYTAIGLVPAIVVARVGGIVACFLRNIPVLLSLAITSFLFMLGCVTMFGLSTYHLQYVYDCFGRSITACDSSLIYGTLRQVTIVYLSFFLLETIIHILQCCFLFYILKVFLGINETSVQRFLATEKQTRILKIVHIGMRMVEMVMAFAMLISITFWLSGVHIHFNKDILSSQNFSDTNLERLANGLVITSLVTITIVIVNNIVSIVAIIRDMATTIKCTTVVIGFCIVVEIVLLGLQSKIENKIDDPAISVYLSFTLIQILFQIIFVVLSTIQIKQTKDSTEVQPFDS